MFLGIVSGWFCRRKTPIKIGDMVRLSKHFEGYEGITFLQDAKEYGFVGYVTSINPGAKYPYVVSFDEFWSDIKCKNEELTKVCNGNKNR